MLDSGTILIILAWLGVGLMRLRAYRRRSQPLVELPAAVRDMLTRVGARPQI